MTDKRFIVYVDGKVIRSFNEGTEARKFARETSKRDEVVVELTDTFLGTTSIYREFSIWF